MIRSTVHVAIYDDFADWEVGHLLVELRTGRFTGVAWDVVTVAESIEAVTTMGGMRVLPDVALGDVEPDASALLVLPGGTMWDEGGGGRFVDLAARFLAQGLPVAAICGSTFGLARAGLLDGLHHTSASAAYLAASGYEGGDLYVDQRAVGDGDLITAGPQSPVQFATATLRHLGLGTDTTLRAYEDLFHGGDPSAFAALMQSAHVA